MELPKRDRTALSIEEKEIIEAMDQISDQTQIVAIAKRTDSLFLFDVAVDRLAD